MNIAFDFNSLTASNQLVISHAHDQRSRSIAPGASGWYSDVRLRSLGLFVSNTVQPLMPTVFQIGDSHDQPVFGDCDGSEHFVL